MQKLRNIANKNNWMILVLGVVLGIFVLSPAMNAGDDLAQDLVEETEKENTIVSELSYEAVPSATQQTVERNSYLIEIIPFFTEADAPEVETPSFMPSPSRVFEVLFEHIISPNSP
ncbi:MAG: hypothetical protein RIF46_11385 [Cyclobacteriaceae bacterium]